MAGMMTGVTMMTGEGMGHPEPPICVASLHCDHIMTTCQTLAATTTHSAWGLLLQCIGLLGPDWPLTLFTFMRAWVLWTGRWSTLCALHLSSHSLCQRCLAAIVALTIPGDEMGDAYMLNCLQVGQLVRRHPGEFCAWPVCRLAAQ
jgi:hypothetical protein